MALISGGEEKGEKFENKPLSCVIPTSYRPGDCLRMYLEDKELFMAVRGGK